MQNFFVVTLTALALLVAVYAGPSDPEPRPDQGWLDLHAFFAEHSAANPDIPIIFYGDSITQGWGGWWDENGTPVFNEYYAPLGVVNYGIGGDKTEHVLWRILNREVAGLAPKLVVLKVGINNLGAGDGVVEIAGGISTIVATLRYLLPNTKILLLGVLPAFHEWAYADIVQINELLRGLHDGEAVHFLDMFGAFSESWGVPRPDLFYDTLHLTTAGYRKWAEVMNPLLHQLIS